MPTDIPAEDEVLGYVESLSNWGRWGEDDQLGTLNLLTADKTRQAASLVQEGVTVSCARTITFEMAPDVTVQPQHFMVESGEGWASGDKVSCVRRQNKWDKRGAFKACNLDANRLRQFSDLPTSVRLDSFASPPVSSPVWRLAVRGTYPPA